jgi:hypothetical protein
LHRSTAVGAAGFFRRVSVRQYELSDCGMVIEIELRQFPIKALITLTPFYSGLI